MSHSVRSHTPCDHPHDNTASPSPAGEGEAPRFAVADLAQIDPVRCPCGFARRAFGDLPDAAVSIHQVEIQLDARRHYHREHTEVYYILACDSDAKMELDDQVVPLAPGRSIYIPPGVRHRAVGKMTILNIVSPPFDPADEWFDDEAP